MKITILWIVGLVAIGIINLYLKVPLYLALPLWLFCFLSDLLATKSWFAREPSHFYQLEQNRFFVWLLKKQRTFVKAAVIFLFIIEFPFLFLLSFLLFLVFNDFLDAITFNLLFFGFAHFTGAVYNFYSLKKEKKMKNNEYNERLGGLAG